MIRLSHIIIAIAFIVFGFYSCQKDSLEINGWSPELISPIINATITIGDLIPERGTTHYEEDNLISLKFINDSIYALNAASFFDISELNQDTIILLEQVVQDDPTIVALLDIAGVEMPFPESQQVSASLFNLIEPSLIPPFNFQFDEINQVSFTSGQIEMIIKNNLPVSIENAQISIHTGLDDPGAIDIFDLAPGETENQSVDLSGIVIDNNIELEITELQIENLGSDMVALTPQTGFEIYFALNNIDIDEIHLTLGLEIPLPSDIVDIDLALFEDFDSGLILEDPIFKIKINNPFNLSGNITGNIDAFSADGVQGSLPVDLDILPNNSNHGTTYDGDLIRDIVALPPHIIEYEAEATIGDSTVITDDGSLLLGVDVVFPLSVNAANLSLKDTIVFNGIDYDITQIERMLLHYNLVNGFPLGTEFNLVLHDSLNPINNLDTLEFVGSNNSGNNIIAPAEVDPFGNVTNSVISSGVLTLSDSEIDHFLNTNKIIIDITLSTSESQNEDQYVSIYADSKCLLKVGLETEINID